MLPIPTKYCLTSGKSESNYKLTAFDGALLNAGVGNVNLIRVSSILPPKAERKDKIILPPGSLVPIAYGSIINENSGETIAASVAVGICKKENYGVIMEYSGKCSKKIAEKIVINMVREAFETRNIPLNKIESVAVEHTVMSIGCAFAAVILWY